MKDELPIILTSLLEKVPGVVVGKKFNSMNFTVRKKVFASTKDGGIVLKLPPEISSVLRRSTLLKLEGIPSGTLDRKGMFGNHARSFLAASSCFLSEGANRVNKKPRSRTQRA